MNVSFQNAVVKNNISDHDPTSHTSPTFIAPASFCFSLTVGQTMFWQVLVRDKAEIDVFLELSCFFNYPADVGNLISGSSAFSKTSLNIWKFTVHVRLKPGLENFEHYFTSM